MLQQSQKQAFRPFLLQLADSIGRHQLPINEQAQEIRDFLRPDAVHHEIVKRLVREIYRSNRCGHLNASIGYEATVTPLTALRRELRHSLHSDVDQVRLVDLLCEETERLFGVQPLPRPPVRDGGATIIPLPRRIDAQRARRQGRTGQRQSGRK
ncbi:MAG: hypothetical protein LJE84_01020 [Gammaproteobacteria bacterium]|nr:hypothetical protein [Gammaproteobacteria bacterium]